MVSTEIIPMVDAFFKIIIIIGEEKMKINFDKIVIFGYFFVCVNMLCTVNVHAYIDPSAVTYIIQGVAGVLIAIGAILTIFRHKIMAIFKKKNNKGTREKIEIKEIEE